MGSHSRPCRAGRPVVNSTPEKLLSFLHQTFYNFYVVQIVLTTVCQIQGDHHHLHTMYSHNTHQVPLQVPISFESTEHVQKIICGDFLLRNLSYDHEFFPCKLLCSVVFEVILIPSKLRPPTTDTPFGFLDDLFPTRICRADTSTLF